MPDNISGRGPKKQRFGYRRSEKLRPGKRQLEALMTNGSIEAIRENTLGLQEAMQERQAIELMHRVLDTLQKQYRRIYCAQCPAEKKNNCDGHQCRVAVEILPYKVTVNRHWRPIPAPGHPLPCQLSPSPTGGGRRSREGSLSAGAGVGSLTKGRGEVKQP
ncbi:MAG: hypothetical protein RDU76_06150 [Candidatus Edwardsbacteria bacterium]|nr:hypothetical protein [Candidatus Edwardsbacteria bacterium]